MKNVLDPIILWLPILAVVFVAWWIYTHQQQAANAARKLGSLLPKKQVKHNEPESSHDPHRASGGGNGHNNHHGGGHHDHPKPPLWKTVLGWSTAIAAAVIVGLGLWWLAVGGGFGQIPGLSPTERFNHYTEQTAARVTPTSAVCAPPESLNWRDVTAPAEGSRSKTLRPPACHRFWFCDKDRDPQCEATSFDSARFRLWCTTPEHSTERVYDHTRDVIIEACRVESKDGTPVDLKYTFEYSPPL